MLYDGIGELEIGKLASYVADCFLNLRGGKHPYPAALGGFNKSTKNMETEKMRKKGWGRTRRGGTSLRWSRKTCHDRGAGCSGNGS